MKTLHHSPSVTSSILLGALLVAAPSLQASLLVYEGFNYGGSAIANISGTAGTGTGTQGNWTVTNVIPASGSASSAYQTTGLSFGSNFATSSGGALLQTSRYNSGADAQTVATIQLNTTTTGTLWSSYLVNYTSIGSANNGSTLQGISSSAAGTAPTLSNQVVSNTLATDRKLGAGYDTAPKNSGNTPFATGTNYLILSSYTNVGTALSGGTTGVATSWAFTQTGFDNWVAAGQLSTNLDTHAFRKMTDDAVTTGTYEFSSVGYLAFRTNAPDSNGAFFTALYDELRYGTTLSDVMALSSVPEPSTYASFAGLASLGGVIALRRRRPDSR